MRPQDPSHHRKILPSSASERRCFEEILGGECLSQAREEAFLGGVRAHRRPEERELSWKLRSTSDLRCDSDQRQGKSPGRILLAPRTTGASLPRHLRPASLQRRV
ncbi:hypothetical protein SLA2020_050900 [Shorea laevis]